MIDNADETISDNLGETELLSVSSNLGKIEIIEPSLKSSLQDYRTWYIWVMIVLSSSYPYYIASNFKIYEEIDVSAETFITVVGSIGAVVNGLSRGMWSAIQDKVGFKIVYMTLLALEILVSFTFVAIHKVKALYLIWVMISFATLGGHFSIFPTLCAKIYGPTMGGKIYAIIFTSFATATLMNWILSKQTSKKNIEYNVLFYILASMSVLAFIMAIFFNETTKVETRGYIENESADIKTLNVTRK